MRTLYRAVSLAEWEDLERCGRFRPHPGGRSLEAKSFATSARDAVAFGYGNFQLDGVSFFVVAVDLPNALHNQLEVLSLDGKAARILQENQQDMFNASLLDVRLRSSLPLPSLQPSS